MPSVTKVFSESIVVGIIFVLLFLAIHSIDMELNVKSSMSHSGMLRQAFIAGMLGHIIFEYTGINKWYVKQYN